jgi:RHS repeat-associated protein
LYDAAQQLSEIRSGSDVGTLIGAAMHDADGHMTKLCESGTVSKTATDCTATGTGSTTLQLVWNALDHLSTATRTGANAIAESYAYDDSGRRISKTSGATTTSYLYDGDAIHAEWTGAIAGNPAAAYVHGAGIDSPALRLTGSTNSPSATETTYLQDGLGSVIGTTSANGTLTANQRFDAWGNRTAATGTVPAYGYTGREPDATGMVYYRARYYHPGIARFASRDPMGMVDSVSPYAYVANNPINLADPFGMEAALAGTTMNPAYWGMLADASFYTGTQTDVRGGGNGGTFTPGQQRMPSITGSQALDALQLGLDVAGLTEPFGFAADLLNAGISYGRGDALGGSLSLGAAVPVLGAAATTGKLGSKAADVLQANKAAGDAFEQAIGAELRTTHEIVAPQITIKTPSGTRTRVDYVTRDGAQIGCVECKASATAPLTSNQASGFPEILQNGGVVVGKGKPGVPGGTVIPPGTQVIIRRP